MGEIYASSGKTDGGFTVKTMVTAALLAALLCVIAPWSIPIKPVAITLATMAVIFVTMVIGWKLGLLVCLVYLLIGAVGVPVFSNFQGGFAKLTGSTGGYLIGYFALVLVGGIFHDTVAMKFYDRNKIIYYLLSFVGFIIGTAALYALGTAYYMYISKTPLKAAIAGCVIPFIPGDIIKTIIGVVLGDIIRRSLIHAGVLN